jgi:hypothetical protein
LRRAFVGTPAYASPEQASGAPVDHTTDLYAVGVMLYELACGRLPFEGWSSGELLIQHITAPVPRLPPEIVATPLGRDLDAVVQGCMAKEPLDRFSSAAELGSKLAALARGERVAIVTPVTPLRRQRRVRTIVLATAGALAVLGLGSFLVERALSHAAAPQAVVHVAPAMPAPATSLVTLTFESEPAGAEVRLVSPGAGSPRGALLGVTPFRHSFPRSEAPVAFELSHAGYAPVRLEVPATAPRTVSATFAKRRAPRSAAWPHRGGSKRHLGSEKTIDPFFRR